MEQTATYTPTPDYAPLLRGLDELADYLRAVAAASSQSVPTFLDDDAGDVVAVGSLSNHPLPVMT